LSNAAVGNEGEVSLWVVAIREGDHVGITCTDFHRGAHFLVGIEQGSADVGETFGVKLDKPIRHVWGHSEPSPGNQLEVTRNGVKGPAYVPECDKFGILSSLGSLDLIEDCVEGHGGAVVQSIAILTRVEKALFMPYSVDAAGDDRGPYFPAHFIQANRSHVIQPGITRYFGG
jgi:hypothetical protein